MAPYFLFGNYFLELSKFFLSFKVYSNKRNILNPQVYFGTPQAAFRDSFKRNNGMIVLPLISFWLNDYERLTEREPVNYFIKVDRTNNKIYYVKPSGKFKLNYSVSAFFDSNFQAQDFLYKLHVLMPRNECSLIYTLDNVPPGEDNFFFMPLKIDGPITNDTEIDSLDVKEVRDVIRYSFNLTGEAVIPIPSFEATKYKIIKLIYLNDLETKLSHSWEQISQDEAIEYEANEIE